MATITVTNVGQNLLRDLLAGNATSAKLLYVALGTDSTPPQPTDTQLYAEVFRKSVSSYTNGTTGELYINMYLAPNDAVGQNIQEVGFFAGPTATKNANTGILIGRGLFSHVKTNVESIQLQLDITI